MFKFLRRNNAVVRDLLADERDGRGNGHGDFNYHPVQYVHQPLNNPGGVRNLAYANLSLPRTTPIGNGVMVNRMMRPCAPMLMQAGQAVITSTYGRQVTGFTSAPLYDRNSGLMTYGGNSVANVYPYSPDSGDDFSTVAPNRVA
jgi:hypothetical protein